MAPAAALRQWPAKDERRANPVAASRPTPYLQMIINKELTKASLGNSYARSPAVAGVRRPVAY
jgi:hypothetical protein